MGRTPQSTPRELGEDAAPAVTGQLLCRRLQGQRFVVFGSSSLRALLVSPPVVESGD